MTSRHLVDLELLPALQLFPKSIPSTAALPAARAGQAAMIAAARTQRPSVSPALDSSPVLVEQRSVPGVEGAPDIAILIYRPGGKIGELPIVFHIHGGGYVTCSAEMMEAQHRTMLAEIRCVVVSVNYRLAPETPHPGPLQDCYTALVWLYRNAASLGADANRIAIVGESAGGGLAAALTLLARDRGEVPIIFQQLDAPMIDDRTCILADPHPYTGEFIWTPAHNHFGWTALLGHVPGAAEVSSYAAAARAKDLSGLPPTFISVGALDLFLEESLEYARRLTRAGVPTELHVYPGAYHGFGIAGTASVAVNAARTALIALRKALHPAVADRS